MVIGIVCPYDIFRSGGVQEHVLAQTEQLRKRGHEVLIITPRPRRAKKEPPRGTIYIGSSATLKTPISTSLELGASFRNDGIDRLFEENNFDVLHVHEPEVPVLGAQIIAKANCPLIASFHAIHPETPFAKTIEALRIPYAKSIFSKLNAITAVSNVAAGFVRSQTGREVTIIPNGIDLEKYHKVNKKNSKRTSILFVGRLEKRKGAIYLIKTFKTLVKKHPGLALDIVGEGPEKSKLKNFVTTNEIPGVVFHGYVNDEEKIRMLQSATVFCSPALFGESFGIVLLEAMASGTVVVAGNNDGYKSVLRETGKMSLVDPTKMLEFSEKLEQMLFNSELRQQWRQWADIYVKQFDYRTITDMYEEVYRSAVKSIGAINHLPKEKR